MTEKLILFNGYGFYPVVGLLGGPGYSLSNTLIKWLMVGL